MTKAKPPPTPPKTQPKTSKSLLFRYPAKDSPVFGVSRATWAALAERKGISETEAIRRAMSDFAVKHREPSPEEAALPTPAQRRYELSLVGSDGLTGQQRLDQFYSLPAVEAAVAVSVPKRRSR